jgi:hypothetical protein
MAKMEMVLDHFLLPSTQYQLRCREELVWLTALAQGLRLVLVLVLVCVWRGGGWGGACMRQCVWLLSFFLKAQYQLAGACRCFSTELHL